MGTVKFQSVVDWDTAQNPRLLGTVESIETLPEKAGGRRVLLLNTDEGKFRIYESFELKGVFDAAEAGDTLDIAFQRVKALKGSKTLKQYNAKLTGK